MVERVLRRDTALGPAPASRPAGPRRGPAAPGDIPVQLGTTTVRVERGSTVLQAAESAGVAIRHYCGGNCSCGTCRVEIVEGARNLRRAESMEKVVLGEAAARGDRLACQAEILGPVSVCVPEWF